MMPYLPPKIILAVGLLLVIFCPVILNLSRFISLPTLSLSSGSAIYVDSPEIYTRERLVNDRYDQDYWLQEQLKQLDQAKANRFIAKETSQQVAAGVTMNSNLPGGQPATGGETTDKFQDPTIDQEFKIRSAIRDAMRQLILENMLDDRHDLRGNSVYGLKFDTTVIPGDNANQRAFVRVNLQVEDPFKFDESDLEPETANLALPHLRAYYSKDRAKSKALLEQAQTIFKKWLDNFSSRLNLHVTNKYKSKDFVSRCRSAFEKNEHDKFIKETLLETINEVIGFAGKSNIFIPAEHKDVYAIMLPKPWGEYMKLFYSHFAADEVCHVPPLFTAEERWDRVYVFKNEQDITEKVNADTRALGHREKLVQKESSPKSPIKLAIKFGETLRSRQLSFQFSATRMHEKDDMYKNFDYYAPSYAPNDALIDFKCGEQLQLVETCGIIVPSGLFKFIERVQKSDIYSYAVFPKNEVAGILSNSSVNLDMSGQLQGSAWLNFGQNRRESGLESVLVGFGDGRFGKLADRTETDDSQPKQDAIEFGWVLSGGAAIKPSQKTQMVLVSVPAWTTELNLTVTTGWLDRDAQEETVQPPFRMNVPVPPDYQPLDALVLSGRFQRKPKILNDLMPSDIKLIACEKAKVLIPGSRLWRSATVTLGAQKADRITVLPNMEGIIAEFKQVEIPYWSDTKAVKAKLQVWTSEGLDTAEHDVEIQLPDNKKSCGEAITAN
jgi:hypothetical protein